MNIATRNDILASNLLFAVLGLLMLFQVAGWISQALALPHSYFSPVQFNLHTLAGLGITTLIRGGLAYAVRRGILAAKLLLAVHLAVSLYVTIDWESATTIGVDRRDSELTYVVMAVNSLLTLAALVLVAV